MDVYHFTILSMGHKHISEQSVLEIENGSKKAQESKIADISNLRYQHCYFEEFDPNKPDTDVQLIFTLRVNFLPARPVYIDIRNLRELILSMTSNISHSESFAFRKELLDLLHHYEKIS